MWNIWVIDLTITRSYLPDDMIIIQMEAVLTPTEQQLAKDKEGI
ncbi:MAG: Na-translocating system protein MpsC family protein [bacterium]